MGFTDLYLIGYNSACCVGWFMVWCMAVYSVATSVTSIDSIPTALANVYFFDSLELFLTISQTAALLEIVHALVGFVRSPVVVTFMQVMSRIVALVAVVYSPAAQSQWGAGLMILSWSSVEVPRYAFYLAALVTGDSVKKTPYHLFWLRYSLFAVLYPTGITGELTVFLQAAADPVFVERFSPVATFVYAKFLPAVYLLGAPFMILSMAGNRKKAMKKRFAKAPPPPRGLVWPVTDATTGARASTATNKAIVAAASADNASKVMAERSWRFGYVKHLRNLVTSQCASPASAIAAAEAGLQEAYDRFQFVAPDGTSASLGDTLNSDTKEQFFTGVVQGELSTPAVQELQVPYKGSTLSGEALKKQIQSWVSYGTIEPSAGEAMTACIDHPEWLTTGLKDRYFVLLGAGSAMGPFLVLMALGANVVAIDLDRPGIWKRLIEIARKSAGSLTFPLQKPQEQCANDEELYASAGCNLFTHTPMIRNWLLNLHPGKPFTVGSYAYLDGALHVQVSLAMDAITKALSENRKNTSLAYLCTPTDLHLIPKEAHDAQVENYSEYCKRLYCIFLPLLNPKKFLRKNPKEPIRGEGGEFYLVNGISVAQGPNYALAKRLQHWRAIIAHSKHKCVVSSNIAPSTSTVSVVHNRTFAWAYEGMPYFTPFEIFAPETSNAVMTALLMYDLNDPSSVANPRNILANPNQLFSSGAFHGGVWRCAYEIDSIGEASVLLYFGRVTAPYLYTGVAVAAAAVAYVYAT